MAYIGRGTDKLSNIEKLDVITFDGSSSYTLQKNSVNFTPNSANSLQVSIDGVVQAGNFTVSGSVIDFGVAIPATSTNDFIFHYGTGLITTPADGTVTTAKLADSSVSLAKLTATGTKDATTFLRGDNTFATVTDTNGLVKLANVTTTDATVTNIEFDSTYINSTYDNYKIFGTIKPSTDGTDFRSRVSVSGVFQTGATYYGFGLVDDSGGGTNDNDAGNWDLHQTVGNASGEGASFEMSLFNMNSTENGTLMSINNNWRNTSGFHGLRMGGGCVNSADVHDGIRFYFSSGNFASGSSITLYGVQK